MREREDIQPAVMRYLKRKGGLWEKNKDVAGKTSGRPDIVGCYRGRYVAIELKRPGAKPRKIQKAYLRLIELAGGITIVASEIEPIAEVLEAAS